MEVHPILSEAGDFTRVIMLFESAMTHYMNAFPSGEEDRVTERVPGGGFGETAIVILADYYTAVNDYEKAIHTVRRGVRWLDGRLEQRFWDTLPDDREYDVEGASPPRTEGGTAPGFYPISSNARHRLAMARLKLGDLEEGKVCLQHIGFLRNAQLGRPTRISFCKTTWWSIWCSSKNLRMRSLNRTCFQKRSRYTRVLPRILKYVLSVDRCEHALMTP